jgi:cell division protein FtsQ
MKILKVLVLVSLLLFIGGGLWLGLNKTDLLKIENIRVEGASAKTEMRLRKILTLKPGDGLWSKAINHQASLINSDPWVDSAEIHREFPRTLVIDIKERKPVAVLGDGKGDFKYVDSSNHVIDRAEPAKIGVYPLILGTAFVGKTDLRAQALELIDSLPKEGVLSREDLSDIQFDEDRGFQIRLNKSGLLVDVGRDNIPLHIDRARRVVMYLDQHNINATHIDSDYAKKVLVKVRKGR